MTGALTAEKGEATDGQAKLIDVEILGHIFEQSITDLEQLRIALAGGAAAEEGKECHLRHSGLVFTIENC
jgi:hypothetical protein